MIRTILAGVAASLMIGVTHSDPFRFALGWLIGNLIILALASAFEDQDHDQ